MKLYLELGGKEYQINTSQGYDLSIHVDANNGPLAWHMDRVSVEPVVAGDFVGSIKKGSPVNFMNVAFNPHGNGTHTECVSHVKDVDVTITEVAPKGLILAQLITVHPEEIKSEDQISMVGDHVIMPHHLQIDPDFTCEALIIRVEPNDSSKKNKVYSGSNPAYIHPKTMEKIVSLNVEHLLIDLPSVDREEDGGKVQTHHIFWDTQTSLRHHCTITELIYVPNEIEDGPYLMNLQVAPFKMDAVPSRPIIYPLI